MKVDNAGMIEKMKSEVPEMEVEEEGEKRSERKKRRSSEKLQKHRSETIFSGEREREASSSPTGRRGPGC